MPEDALEALHDHLAATAELPVDTPASHYLGEAEAVVADARQPGTPERVVRERVEQARELLGEIDEVDDEAAAEHVDAARAHCGRILAES